MPQLTIDQAMQVAVEHHRAGRLQKAEQLYRQIIAHQPEHSTAIHYLGLIANQMGRGDVAIEMLRRCIVLRPTDADAFSNLGNILRKQGQIDEAIAAYRQAIALEPNLAEACSNLGNALKDAGQLDEAIDACRRAIALKPELAEAHNILGNALRRDGQVDEAIFAYRRAIGLKFDYAEAYGNLGVSLQDKGQLDEAIAAYRHATDLQPDSADALYNLGVGLTEKGELDLAIAAYRRAIALKPNMAEANNNLGVALKHQGRPQDARIAHQTAVELAPENPSVLSNFLLALQYNPEYSASMIYLECRRFETLLARPPQDCVRPIACTREPNSRLKIGYVSPDFRDHVVGRNVLPLLQRHDRDRFEVFCYANHAAGAGDLLTARFRTCADKWRDIVKLSDQHVAELVRHDGIDILVDLALHTANNRLPVFARRPAPVQVTWAGYPGTTGLNAIDYRLTDPYLDPPGQRDDVYSETSIRLPDTFWCYDPASIMLGLDREPHVAPLPALNNGYLTLGCLNNFAKVNSHVLDLWAEVLRGLPRSRLLVGAHDGSHRQGVLDRLGQNGIKPNRIEFVTPCPRGEYLEHYNRIDMGLDTLPYNGHTSSLDAMWMGVPVVALAGQTVVGRAGVSQLSNLGLPEFIAYTPQGYVKILTAIASDLPKLAELRSTLRPRMLQSPLTDSVKFARNVEEAYRKMWRLNLRTERGTEGRKRGANSWELKW